MTLVPRPPPEREVPGVGRLTIAQADQVLASARQAVNQVLSYGRFYGASVSTEALDAVAHAGALKALEGLGYRPSADPAEVLAQVGEWLDWARCPFTLG